jgi:CDP-glycerol glycerophosphotransferase (TagB/SpsB family)
LPPLVNDKDSNSRFFDFDVLMEKFLPPGCDFSSVNVLVSLHPRINLELIKSYHCPENIRLIAEPVEVFIPLCDVFISTYSSTIRTAVALGIPVINYDILNFDYELFRDVAGIAYTPDESHYGDVLRDCISEGKKYKELTDQLRTANLLSSTLDGSSNQRILKAITLQS